ncbi:MAG: Multidrug resistance protein stp [Firmicutes bacterium ADurb.Bin456]|nr:MAG: Multidrug resistance protein stp [Firmicutes bacterium ADurb.Bin456]
MNRQVNKWKILIAVLAGIIMGPLDASIVYIALPSIARYFYVDPSMVGWVSMAYLLVMSSFLLAFGRLGDMFGFKRLHLTGLLVFTGTSALCGLAPSLGALILFRGLQAIGAGLTMAMAPAIITEIFPPRERGKALGLNGMVVAVGLALGPSLGGLLVQAMDWRLIFFVNVPIGIAAYIWGFRVLPEARRVSETRSGFDLQGSLLAFSGLFALLLFISRGQALGWTWPFLLLGLLALVLLSLFVLHEKRTPEPLLDLTLFLSPVFTAGNGAALLNFMTQYVIVFATPFLLQEHLGYSAGQAGLTMTAFPLTVLIVAPLAGALSDKVGQRGLAFAGSLLCTTAAVALATLGPAASPFELIWRLCLFGTGTGLFQSPNTSAIMGAAPGPRLGIASGVLATVRNIGMVMGIALAGVVLTTGQITTTGGAEASFHGFQSAFLAAALVSLGGTALCLLWSNN